MYHVKSGLILKCDARKQKCPFQDQPHFESLEKAVAFYEDQYTSHLTGVKKGVPPFMAAELLAGERYMGLSIPNQLISPSRKLWREHVGDEAASLMEKNKAARDRGHHYHMTLVGPPEMTGEIQSTPLPVFRVSRLEAQGIGQAIDGNKEAWFVICESPEMASWRQDMGLPPKDLHITLGFINGDVHTRPKGIESMVLEIP